MPPASPVLCTLSLHDALPIWERSGEITEKNGFSVVAATRSTQRFSTPGSSASCCALLNRCTSSTNRTVSWPVAARVEDRKSTRLNSSHGYISYAVFCLRQNRI